MTVILPDARQYVIVPPITIVEYYILAALMQGALHGIGIFEVVARWTDSQMLLVPGTLYTALKRMYNEGWITFADPPSGERNDQRRKLYRLTAKGRGVLRDFKQWAACEAQRDSGLFPDVQLAWSVPTADSHLEQDVAAHDLAESETDATPATPAQSVSSSKPDREVSQSVKPEVPAQPDGSNQQEAQRSKGEGGISGRRRYGRKSARASKADFIPLRKRQLSPA